MIYIINQVHETQLKLIKYLQSKCQLEFIFWLYPESDINRFLEFKFIASGDLEGEPVTTYDDGYVARRSKRQKIDLEILETCLKDKQFYQNNIDSLCLYKANQFQWHASIVGHEGVILVKDDSIINELKLNGFDASLNAPDWW